jgi:AraC family transcriptional regulator
MPARDWITFEGVKDAQFSVRANSQDRHWTRINAALYVAGSGRIEVPFAPCHNFTMHVGAPIDVACRCDGAVRHRLQVRGDIDIIPAGCPVAWEYVGSSAALSITIDPLLVRSTAESMGVNADSVTLVPMLQIKDPKLRLVASALKSELESGDVNDRLCADSLGTALIAHLLRRYARWSEPQRGFTRRQRSAVSDYINAHIASNYSLEDLAGAAGVGLTTFKVLFKQSFGVPVHQYVIRRRVELAMSLMSTGRRNLNEVAQRSGFVDQSHMGRCFKRVLGMTPASVAREYQ